MSMDKPAREMLRQFVDAIERLESEKKDLSEDIAAKWKEVKSAGFDKAALKNVIKLRKMKAYDRAEMLELMDIYQHALGMTPIEEAIASLDDSDIETTFSGPGIEPITFGGKRRRPEAVN